MAQTELWGLFALTSCLSAMVAWLQLQRASTAQRSFTELRFYVCLAMSAFALVAFAVDFIGSPLSGPLYVPPFSWQELGVSLLFLFNFGLAVGEIIRTLRARNASPADSDR